MTERTPAAGPRVRFAPSPTGYFHVGGARSALFNWLYARQHEGTFVLRIEDTDEERNRVEWTEGIISALEWLGMPPDEGPYFQSAQGPSRVGPRFRRPDRAIGSFDLVLNRSRRHRRQDRRPRHQKKRTR